MATLMQRTFGDIVGMAPMVEILPDIVECTECGSQTRYPLDYDGQPYCEDCAVDCEECGNTILRDDAVWQDDAPYCEDCHDEVFVRCDDCGDYIRRDDAREHDRDYYCECCFDENFYYCDRCNDYYRDDQMTCTENGECYCQSCYDELFVRCEGCGCEVERDYAFCTDCGDVYCENCYPGDSECEDNEDPDEYYGYAKRVESAGLYNEIRSRRTYGVELETARCPGYSRLSGRTKFTAKHDGSIDGMEFVSPVLSGDDGLHEVRNFCAKANEMDFAVDAKCGYHVHIGLQHDSTDSIKSVLYGYHVTESVWMSFVPSSRRENSFCASLDWGPSDLDGLNDRNDLIDWSNSLRRYQYANFAAYAEHRTIEIRLHTATLNGDKVCNWIKAHVRFIDWCASKTPAEIVAKFAGSNSAKFAALSEILGDVGLVEFYRKRAESFGTTYADCAAV